MTTILVVEDEAGIREEIIDMLAIDNYDVIEAADGRQGLKLARKHLPDLIISDILMPHLDGYGLFQALKADSRTAVIPFIFLTALSNRDDVRKGMNLGADDYLTKPFDYHLLSGGVRARLQRHAAQEQLRLKRFAARLINAQERERQQTLRMVEHLITEPLHGLHLQLATASLEEQLTPAELQALINQLINQVNALSLQLQPVMIRDLGIISILKWLFERFEIQYGLEVAFQWGGRIPLLPAEVKLALFRIVEEALNNIVQHAGVLKVGITADFQPGRLLLDINDQGCGFDADVVLANNRTTGLLTMIERVEQIGGTINIHATPNVGCAIQIELPHQAETVNRAARPPLPAASSTKKRKAPSKPGARFSVIIADDHDLMREGLVRLIENNPLFRVMATVSNGHTLAGQLRREQPDLLILDMTLPGLSSMELLRTIAQQYKQVRVLAISPFAEEVYAAEALKNGALGYLLKDAGAEEITAALIRVADGKSYVSESLSGKLMDWYAQGAESDSSEPNLAQIIDRLTRRERQIMFMVIEGLTSAEIGEKLAISRRTAETHRNNMMKKLGAKNQTQLLRFALQHNLVSLDAREADRS